MRLTVFTTAAVSSAVALVGFAGAAQASATIDLIWIDVSNVDSDGNPICLRPALRDCPQIGTVLSAVNVTERITLGVIVTAGPNGLQGASVSVDYRDALPKLSVVDFGSLSTTEPLPYLPLQFIPASNEPAGWVQNIMATMHPTVGIGLPAGNTAYLGTVTFHKNVFITGTFEIAVGTDDPNGIDAVLSLDPLGVVITDTSVFNSAFLVNLPVHPTPSAFPTPTPTATPTPIPGASGCLCEVTNINPNQVVLQNVGTGGKRSDRIRKMVMTFHAVDAPGASCDPGEFSAPTPVNLKMEDDRGNILIDSAKTVVCKQGATTLMRGVFFQGPLNCENGAVPSPEQGFSLGSITSTGSAPGTTDYVESTKIKCFE